MKPRFAPTVDEASHLGQEAAIQLLSRRPPNSHERRASRPRVYHSGALVSSTWALLLLRENVTPYGEPWSMECVILNKRQQDRVEVITRFMDGKLDVCAAAQALKVSVRQFYRIVAKFRERGAASVVHGNTGSRPANRTSDEVRERLRALAGEGGTYHDFNTSHIHEVLIQEGIDIGRFTLDRILKEMGLRQVQRKKPNRSYRRRERRSAEGMMLQIDASHHDWLEGHGPKMTLVGAVDDATGKVLFLLFRPTEDQVGYLLLLKTIATTYGLPMSYYHDRHTILRSPKEASIEDELAGKEPQSQLQRIMSELGCQSIAASTPQAKGRIERLWRTLQDRLVKELRAAGVNTLEEANAYLPGFLARYNERFAKEPADGKARGLRCRSRWTWTTTSRSERSGPCARTIRSPGNTRIFSSCAPKRTACPGSGSRSM